MKRCVCAVGLAVLLTACAKPPGSGPTWAEWKYKTFCGQGHPDPEDPKTKRPPGLTEKAWLDSIDPFDDIDEMCKRHDLCWLANEKNEKEKEKCDDWLQSEATNFTGNARCMNVAGDIDHWLTLWRRRGVNGLLDSPIPAARLATGVIYLNPIYWVGVGAIKMAGYPPEDEKCRKTQTDYEKMRKQGTP